MTFKWPQRPVPTTPQRKPEIIVKEILALKQELDHAGCASDFYHTQGTYNEDAKRLSALRNELYDAELYWKGK